MRSFPIFVAMLAAALSAQDAPRVVSLEPEHGAVDVDWRKVDELVVRFDCDMSRSGYSFCGGGPTFPKAKGARWKDARTCVLAVELAPDHSYELRLNCPSSQNFRSKAGAALVPVPWKFSTSPAKPLSRKEQRALNRAAFDELLDTLAERYSYYDHRGIDWPKLAKKHRRKVLAAKSSRGWAQAVSAMLAPTGDLHLYFRIGETTFGTGSRSVDALMRYPLLKDYVPTLERGQQFAKGRTVDDIDYLLIGSWMKEVDFDAIESWLATLDDSNGLIVDVRANSGGDESLARRIAAWFVSGEKPYAKNDYRIAKGEKGFGKELVRSIQGNEDGKRYGGPVAVLMSRYCMSSCEAFLLMMKQADECTLIGQRSYGSSGNPKPYELSNGVTVFVPSWRAKRLDGTVFEGEGIAPDIDVAVDPADLESRDPILERALEHLRQ